VSGTIQPPVLAVNLQGRGVWSPLHSPWQEWQPRSLPSRWGLCMACWVGDSPGITHPPGCCRTDRSQLSLTVLITRPETCIEFVLPLSSPVSPAPQVNLQAAFPHDAHILHPVVPEVRCRLSQRPHSPHASVCPSQRVAHRPGCAARPWHPTCCQSSAVGEESDPCLSRSWNLKAAGDGQLPFARCRNSCCPLPHQARAVPFLFLGLLLFEGGSGPAAVPCIAFKCFHLFTVPHFGRYSFLWHILNTERGTVCNCGLPTSHSEAQTRACKLNDKQPGSSKDKVGGNKRWEVKGHL